MATQTRKMTASEFLSLPVSNTFHELLHGEEIMSPSPTRKHQVTLGRLFSLLQHLKPDGEVILAPMDVYLDQSNVVQPDLLWIAEDSQCRWVDGKYLTGAPELVVEIFSPGTARRDKKDKFRLYEKFGVREYWMVDPDEQWLEIWQLKDAHFVLIDVFGPDDPFTSPLLGKGNTKVIFPD
jgi:Uma2 family endonuclease